MQHPIIRPLVFGEHGCHSIIQLITGWLLGEIQCFNKREHTLSSGWGHYLMTHKVVFLFISDWRNTEGGSLDYPRYLPWDCQGGGGCSSCTPSLVEWHLPKPLLRWLVVGAYDLRGWMALNGGPVKNQWSISLVVAPDGGSGLEGSQQLSPPSNHWGQGGLETNKSILSTLQALDESTCHLPTNNRLGTFQMFLQVPGQTHDVGTFMEHFECNINMCNTSDPP